MDDEKKTRRKIKRFTTRLFSSKGILCTDVRGPNIIICNAGQATGLDKKYILELVLGLPNSIEMPKFIAEKGETYSFLVFNSTENSSLFYDTYNGKSKFSEDTAFYMCFVETVPNTDVICYHPNPKGLQIIEDFITPEEELQLIKLFDWDENDNRSNLKNRLVKHYGYEFRYGTNDVDLHSPLLEMIPKECNMLWMRLKQHGLDVREPDQLTVNKYTPGHGIPNHVDNHSPFGDTILSLSLGSTIVMDWKHHSNIQIPIIVKARSMLVMQGEARTGPCECEYKTMCDSVEPSSDNVQDDVASNLEELHVHQVRRSSRPHDGASASNPSITIFYGEMISDGGGVMGWCTVQLKIKIPEVGHGQVLHEIGNDMPQHIEEVAAGERPFDEVRPQYFRAYNTGPHIDTKAHLMVGFPNHMRISEGPPVFVMMVIKPHTSKQCFVSPQNVGIRIAGERSDGLLRECRERLRDGGAGSELLADCVRLDLLHAGLIDACADVIICIAVIHHFSSVARRLQAIATICRLLRPGGKALITVWAKDQTKSNYLSKTKAQTTLEEQHVTVNGISFPVHENRTQFQHNDVLVPWKLRQLKDNKTLENIPKDTLLRFYHVFEEGELDELCRQLPLKVEQTFYEEGNWCVVVKK
ncbi:unnamed protein product [Diatraea saccharalis]|uniref:Fe2OG dioxygenase domain-containing protein n=1 Tax=Diatraea saccharalis TaxID=40085 RepID=A0A9N9WGS1_9NEOP|nr:unnamed protein product [Diatraea saccharalis]